MLENYTHRRTYPEKGSDWKISCRSSDIPLHAGSAYRLQWRLWSPMVVRNQRQNLPVLIHEHCEKYTNNCPDPPSYVPEWDVLHPECQLPPEALCVWVKAAGQVSTSRSTAMPTWEYFSWWLLHLQSLNLHPQWRPMKSIETQTPQTKYINLLDMKNQ